jgi:hypothetical protein
MSRPALTTEEKNAQAIYELHSLVFPHVYMYDKEAKCKMCHKKDDYGLCGDWKEWAVVVGEHLCKHCYGRMPRLTRMFAQGYYRGQNNFAYEDQTSDADEKETQDKNASALRGYEPSLVTGCSQPNWERPLTKEWNEGYNAHLLRIRSALIQIVVDGRGLNDRQILKSCE